MYGPNETSAVLGTGRGDLTAAQELKRHGPFNEIDAMQQRVLALCDRVEKLAEKLVGSNPKANGNPSAAPVVSGLLGALQSSSEAVGRRVMEAHAALSTIEDTLP